MLNKDQQEQLRIDAPHYTNTELEKMYDLPKQMLVYYLKKIGAKRLNRVRMTTLSHKNYIKQNWEQDDKLISMKLDIPVYRVKVIRGMIDKDC